MAQFPKLLDFELKQRWMAALGLQRNTENLKRRFDKYWVDAQKEIGSK